MKHMWLRCLPLLTGLFSFAAVAGEGMDGSASRAERDIVDALQKCRAISDRDNRLSCFDEVASKNAPPVYSGKLGFKTAPFELLRPHVLRYRSEGVIFVLYLLDEKGSVVQNLHIGGGGEDNYLIEKPGTYSLQIDGSAAWKIWIEPGPVEPASKANIKEKR